MTTRSNQEEWITAYDRKQDLLEAGERLVTEILLLIDGETQLRNQIDQCERAVENWRKIADN